MAVIHAKEKRERSLGAKLFLKGDRCSSPKCVTVRRPERPGPHKNARRTLSDYGRQLQEKQRIRIYFGLTNRQMEKYFSAASPVLIANLLERRLDHVAFALGFAKSPRIGRQLISHGHIVVNGRKVTIPSYMVKPGDVIGVRPESRGAKLFEDFAERMKTYQVPGWLAFDAEKREGTCVKLPSEDNHQFPFEISLASQFYAR
ncbi:MAG: 30S ribosomal protein S4 [Candidatus Brennerbacteria bacterium]|nr:30S ribosomal protein S4 [Candidatus Brennerbacteria bacterium]